MAKLKFACTKKLELIKFRACPVLPRTEAFFPPLLATNEYKMKTYRTIIFNVLCGCETWFLMLWKNMN